MVIHRTEEDIDHLESKMHIDSSLDMESKSTSYTDDFETPPAETELRENGLPSVIEDMSETIPDDYSLFLSKGSSNISIPEVIEAFEQKSESQDDFYDSSNSSEIPSSENKEDISSPALQKILETTLIQSTTIKENRDIEEKEPHTLSIQPSTPVRSPVREEDYTDDEETPKASATSKRFFEDIDRSHGSFQRSPLRSPQHLRSTEPLDELSVIPLSSDEELLEKEVHKESLIKNEDSVDNMESKETLPDITKESNTNLENSNLTLSARADIISNMIFEEILQEVISGLCVSNE